MDDTEFTIKPDEYEPDLFNDMAVQEEITVGSTENVIGGSVEQDYGATMPTVIPTSSLNMMNPSQMIQSDMRNRPKVIYLKSNNMAGKPVRMGGPNLKVIPLSKLNQDNNTKVIHLGQSVRAIPSFGGNITRVLNPNTIRNGPIQVTKLSNFNLSKLPHGQKFVINKQNNQFSRSITPIVSLSNQLNFAQPHSNQQTIIQQINTTNQSNQSALKLEPGDSGFYNLTGGNGPTRYYPRMHSPDKDSLDGSQEMSNVYKTNGLRKYARSVCDKVKEKGTTTYSEVADELVHEYAAEHPMIPAQQLHYIQKNIRRRVYDALNVLMALKVLEKEKKEIKWKGLPVNLLEECKQLEEEKNKKSEALQQKVEELSELVLQLISYKNLVGRNRQWEKEGRAVPLNERIKLPFLVITTNNNTVIDCNISPEKLEYMFTFDQPFEMQDEFQTLKQSGFTLCLGSSQCTELQYKRCLELVPNTLRFYVEAIYNQRPAIVPDFMSLHRRNKATNNSSLPLVGGGLQSPHSSRQPVMSSNVLNQGSISSSASKLQMQINQGGGQFWGGPGVSGEPTTSKHHRFYAGSNLNSAEEDWTSSLAAPRPSLKFPHPNHLQSSKSIVGHSSSSSAIVTSQQPYNFEEDIEVMDEDADFPSD